MKYFLAAITFFILSLSGFAQSKIQKHTVQKGETISQIAQKYSISTSEIYRLNPDSQNGIKPDMILLIPATLANKEIKTETPATSGKTHVVVAGETIYALTKKYQISEDELFKANPNLKKDGLKLGEALLIPSKKQEGKPSKSEKNNSKDDLKKDNKKKEVVFHQVVAKETKYSIAKQYNISVEELEESNPEIKESLQIGFRLKITPNTKKVNEQHIEVPEDQSVIIKTEIKKPAFNTYVVQPKETFYGLTRKFGLSQEELLQLNPELAEGVKEGMQLKYPATIIPVEPVDNNIVQLAKSLKTDVKKQLVLLLPFNITKIEGDTINSTASRLKTDKFLNMTLDFYSGALMAIDSARTLGLNIDIKILDSQETKNSSNVASLIQNHNLQNADVVIGPFYQANVEKTAELLNKSKVPVISPLSKETGKWYPNLFQSMPSTDLIKNAMLDYMRSKNGNIMAIVEPKKLSTKQFLSQNHKDVRLIGLSGSGSVMADSIAKKMVKGRINYVILDSERTGMIMSTNNALIKLMETYDIQLVILEKNETLDFEEVALEKLAKLRLLYPSLTRDNETPEGRIFEKDYREKNKIFPSTFATRGFDITFDTMLRLSQEKSFVETIASNTTEGVENKFEYEKKATGAYANKGFYMLYYDSDLSVKEAN